ncbi:hypothetical protein VNO80_16588 [Phaseolus coccineus]|uniref:Uncharacterized protein n=1 Tax=Phaseolus coccineus TaxID=3886 RepID=A0AAN9R437_PHACN
MLLNSPIYGKVELFFSRWKKIAQELDAFILTFSHSLHENFQSIFPHQSSTLSSYSVIRKRITQKKNTLLATENLCFLVRSQSLSVHENFSFIGILLGEKLLLCC